MCTSFKRAMTQNLHTMKRKAVAFVDDKKSLSNTFNSFCGYNSYHAGTGFRTNCLEEQVTSVFLSFQNMNTKLFMLCSFTSLFRALV